ncbi:hypothetical protein V8C44DRAFT_336443 [Trichoderma aethiopicum]
MGHSFFFFSVSFALLSSFSLLFVVVSPGIEWPDGEMIDSLVARSRNHAFARYWLGRWAIDWLAKVVNDVEDTQMRRMIAFISSLRLRGWAAGRRNGNAGIR